MKKKNKTNYLRFVVFLAVGVILAAILLNSIKKSIGSGGEGPDESFWEIQSIDTMKYSRDPAAEKLYDREYEKEIETQVTNIAKTGATHIGIATPYDEDFLPFLKKWVASARRNNLKIWYRGNWSNWEGWFGFERKMSFEEHIQKSVEFIKDNPELFEDGDSFTACPECENGAQGDPRITRKIAEYRDFLIKETLETKKAFERINKNVSTNWLSMNGDVANLVMDRETIAKTGGLISIDHYVRTPEQLNDDVNRLAENTGAKIFFGEFGAPIPDIHGNMSEEDQAKWVDEALDLLSKNKHVVGINYWTNRGGSTEAWKGDNSERKVVSVLRKYFKPTKLYGEIKNQAGFIIRDVKIINEHREFLDEDGNYSIGVIEGTSVEFSKDGFDSVKIEIGQSSADLKHDVVMRELNPSWYTKFIIWVKSFFGN